MPRSLNRVMTLALLVGGVACAGARAATGPVPAPATDTPLAAKSGRQTLVIAGGCFWGIQAVYQHTKGVIKAISGYSGGSAETAQYELVGTGRTGHAESVEITFDPSKVTVGQLLQVFFAVAHDPTQLNYQGPDHGTQYRSAIFFADADQERIAKAYVAQLDKAGVFPTEIVTKIVPLTAFYKAEDYHQDYATLHPYEPYIMINDAPKVKNLKKDLPALYVEK